MKPQYLSYPQVSGIGRPGSWVFARYWALQILKVTPDVRVKIRCIKTINLITGGNAYVYDWAVIQPPRL